jgi:hypothetical protein
MLQRLHARILAIASGPNPRIALLILARPCAARRSAQGEAVALGTHAT